MIHRMLTAALFVWLAGSGVCSEASPAPVPIAAATAAVSPFAAPPVDPSEPGEPGENGAGGAGGADGEDADWPNVGNDPGGARHSKLDQIHRGNVAGLQVAWTYHTGELDRGGKTIECTALVVDGVMYITTAYLRVIALDAATGKELWSFDPFAKGAATAPIASGGVNRGLAWWSDGLPDGARRVLHGAADGRLLSIDARTGRLDVKFGAGGWVDLRAGGRLRDAVHPPGGRASVRVHRGGRRGQGRDQGGRRVRRVLLAGGAAVDLLGGGPPRAPRDPY